MAMDEPRAVTDAKAAIGKAADQATEFLDDMTGEIKREVLDIQGGRTAEGPDSDLLVRKHVLGLILLLFSIVARVASLVPRNFI